MESIIESEITIQKKDFDELMEYYEKNRQDPNDTMKLYIDVSGNTSLNSKVINDRIYDNLEAYAKSFGYLTIKGFYGTNGLILIARNPRYKELISKYKIIK